MLILLKVMNDFSVREVEVQPMMRITGRLTSKGGIAIMKDFPESTDWYIAEIAKVLNDQFVVNWLHHRGSTISQLQG
jgi:hypothetical protein